VIDGMQVSLVIEGVKAQLLLEARLDNVFKIVNRYSQPSHSSPVLFAQRSNAWRPVHSPTIDDCTSMLPCNLLPEIASRVLTQSTRLNHITLPCTLRAAAATGHWPPLMTTPPPHTLCVLLLYLPPMYTFCTASCCYRTLATLDENPSLISDTLGALANTLSSVTNSLGQLTSITVNSLVRKGGLMIPDVYKCRYKILAS
jgi:hypothetical protein